ncbi:hypothetical protein EDP1_3836 [Pseudomonas putida S610]|uniref:fimbrial biogenesis chaperone n=1 Tax=Pseudomonas putida TaxID=303 RepID=UPI0003C5B8B4|nr:molecular chaperone [Pseudomonas putida]EST17033.1 hypothetical protein EDP1_3836 [Pseudomonas putida S610]
MPGFSVRAASLRAIFSTCAAALLLILPVGTLQAALTLSNTRIVYPSDSRSTSVVVRNPSKQIYAAQVWINTQADDSVTAVPLLPSPQLFRLDPGQEQLLQISALPNDLPDDRESLFFFNLQEIPQAVPGQYNALNIALRTRLKLFYRPHAIKGSPATQANQLQFSLHSANGRTQLKAHNPTPFHITFSQLEVVGAQRSGKLEKLPMLSPFSDHYVPLEGVRPGPDLQARFSIINDFGGYTKPVTLPIANRP